jgi:hypothetical protein
MTHDVGRRRTAQKIICGVNGPQGIFSTKLAQLVERLSNGLGWTVFVMCHVVCFCNETRQLTCISRTNTFSRSSQKVLNSWCTVKPPMVGGQPVLRRPDQEKEKKCWIRKFRWNMNYVPYSWYDIVKKCTRVLTVQYKVQIWFLTYSKNQRGTIYKLCLHKIRTM